MYMILLFYIQFSAELLGMFISLTDSSCNRLEEKCIKITREWIDVFNRIKGLELAFGLQSSYYRH